MEPLTILAWVVLGLLAAILLVIFLIVTVILIGTTEHRRDVKRRFTAESERRQHPAYGQLRAVDNPK
jgi:hypothetical protein